MKGGSRLGCKGDRWPPGPRLETSALLEGEVKEGKGANTALFRCWVLIQEKSADCHRTNCRRDSAIPSRSVSEGCVALGAFPESSATDRIWASATELTGTRCWCTVCAHVCVCVCECTCVGGCVCVLRVCVCACVRACGANRDTLHTRLLAAAWLMK